MDRNSRPVTSFVKKEECTSVFPVPSHLVESFGGDLPSKVTFRTDESDKTWNLSIEKFKDRYFFTYGWQEFEEEVSLQSRKFLMYKPAASSKQKGKNKEEEGRKISGYAHEATNSSISKNKAKGLGVEKKLEFSRKMKNHHQYRLDIPQDFALGTGLRKGDVLKLKNDEGREWQVHVSTRTDRISLCGDWCEFVIDNKLMIGSKVSFAWLSENTIQTKILEVGSKTPLSNSAYKRKDHGLLEGDAESDEEKLPEHSLMDVMNEDDDIDKKWKFSKDLKKQHSHSLDLPMSFSGVFGKATSGNIELVDSKKRRWRVRVVKYKKCSSFRISSGWIDFLVGNKVSVGSAVVFKSIPNCNNVIKVRVIDGGHEKKELFVKRPRGRPYAFSSKLTTSP